MSDWQKVLQKSENETIRECANEMTPDGFYPYYTQQPRRILFIGRDAYGMEECDYIKVFYDCYRRAKKVGDSKSLNQHLFHARMLHIAWGILNEMADWESIPWAERIGDTFGMPHPAGISFSFMNLCKLRTDEEGVLADIPLIQAFCSESTRERNFIGEQISLLAPDLIISMNLGKLLDFAGKSTVIERREDVIKSEFETHGHSCLRLDYWHFSARKSHVKKFYHPICEVLKSSGW